LVGAAVSVGTGVRVGGIGVSVGGTGVSVGGTAVGGRTVGVAVWGWRTEQPDKKMKMKIKPRAFWIRVLIVSLSKFCIKSTYQVYAKWTVFAVWFIIF
jgi:hypothetical protein